jgi:hypothetical protein
VAPEIVSALAFSPVNPDKLPVELITSPLEFEAAVSVSVPVPDNTPFKFNGPVLIVPF